MLSKYLLRQSQAPLFVNYGKYSNESKRSIGRMAFASSASSGAAAVNHLEKDYYTILDIPLTATPE